MSAPFNDAELERLRELHADGFTLGQIALELGRGRASVSRWAAKLDLSFDRSQTEKAIAARKADNRAARADLAERLYRRASDLIDRLEADTWSSRIVTPRGKVIEITGDDPGAQEERWISQAVTSYMAAAMRAETVDQDHADVDSGLSLLGKLNERIAAVVAQMPDEPAADQ